MRQFRWAAAVLAVVVSTSVGSAQPQPTGGPPAPSFGGYLNLINRGGSPALNYYGIIRPQQQLAQQFGQIAQQQRQLNQNQQQLGQELQAAEYGVYGQSVFGYNRFLRSTGGYVPTFNNTGHYFNTNPALGAGGAGGSRSGSVMMGGIGQGGGQVGPRAPFAGAVGSGASPSRGASVGGVGGGIRR